MSLYISRVMFTDDVYRIVDRNNEELESRKCDFLRFPFKHLFLVTVSVTLQLMLYPPRLRCPRSTSNCCKIIMRYPLHFD